MKYVYIFFAITLLLQPLSQFLERVGLIRVGKIESFGQLFQVHTIVRLITEPYVVIGVFLAMVSLIFWLATLSSWNVSYLYPLGSSLTQILLVAAAVIFLHESMSVQRWMGVGIIAIGCVLLNWK